MQVLTQQMSVYATYNYVFPTRVKVWLSQKEGKGWSDGARTLFFKKKFTNILNLVNIMVEHYTQHHFISVINFMILDFRGSVLDFFCNDYSN